MTEHNDFRLPSLRAMGVGIQPGTIRSAAAEPVELDLTRRHVVHMHRPTSPRPVCGAPVPDDRMAGLTAYRSDVTCDACAATVTEPSTLTEDEVKAHVVAGLLARKTRINRAIANAQWAMENIDHMLDNDAFEVADEYLTRAVCYLHRADPNHGRDRS